MKIRWNLEIQINLICLDEATRTRADDQNPERRKNPVLLPNRSKTPGHSFRFNLIKDFSSRSDNVQGGPDDQQRSRVQLHLLVGDDCVHNK